MFSIERYSGNHKNLWDIFIRNSKNYHFMFYRDYMDYHADRFQDHSLMFFNDKKKLVAVFPANVDDNVLYSHQGLTFGGIIVDKSMKVEMMLELFDVLVNFCKHLKFKEIIYKRMPFIYASLPSDEDLYALFRVEAKLCRRDISSAIYFRRPFKYSKGRKYNLSVAKKHNLSVQEEQDFSSFWTLLNNVLAQQHNAKSVHTIDEIQGLKGSFPVNIKLFTARDVDGTLLAGVVMYSTNLVAHTQYLANSTKGKELGALDFVLDYLIKNIYRDHAYFDFGISNEDNGHFLNKGLIAQKEGFGARAICHDFYRIKVI